MPIRAVIFDIGGVFFPWPRPAFFEDWEARLGLRAGQLQPHLWHGPDVEAANIGVITAEEYSRRCAVRLGADETQVQEIIETAFGGEPMDEALVTYVGALRTRVGVAALTNTWSFGRALIERRGISALFDLVVTSAEEGIRKPDSRIYEIALKRLAIQPAEALFVDDSGENVAAARALGMHGVLFRMTATVIAEVEAILTLNGVSRV